MALEDTVIATVKDMDKLYKVGKPKRFYDVLVENGLLPLTVASLSTDIGKRVMELAAWLHFSGGLANRDFNPVISAENDQLERIKERIEIDPFEYRIRNNGTYETLRSISHSGALGRLCYLMGVSMPDSEYPNKKYHRESLPDFFFKITESSPKKDPRRHEMMHTLTCLIFEDRLRLIDHPRQGQFYLDLFTHQSEDQARSYAASVIKFLNVTHKTNHTKPLFTKSSIYIHHRVDGDGYECRLNLNHNQVASMQTRKPPVLLPQPAYFGL